MSQLIKLCSHICVKSCNISLPCQSTCFFGFCVVSASAISMYQTHMYTHTHTHTHTHAHTHTHTHTHTYLHTHTHTHTHTCTHTHTHTHTYIHTHIRTHIRTHTHTELILHTLFLCPRVETLCCSCISGPLNFLDRLGAIRSKTQLLHLLFWVHHTT